MSHPEFVTAASASSLLLLALAATAPNARAEDAYQLDTLIVTAGLEPVSARDVARSVTVITREEIEQRQVKYLADLLRDVPGFAVSQAGGPGTQTQIRVRGAESNHLLVLVDGIRANDPASNDEFQFQYALTSNIERIEIIRGPQSATWGTDALAGVINIIRRKEVSSDYLAVNGEYGSFDSSELGADGGLARDRYQLSGGISFHDTDGTNLSRSGHERDGAKNANANATLDISASDALHLVFSGQLVDAHTDWDDVDFYTTGLPTDANLETRANRAYLRGEAAYEPQSGPWSGAFSVNWLDTSNDNFRDGVRDSSTDAQSLELRLKSSVLLGRDEAQNHRLTFALDRDEVDFEQRGLASFYGDPNQDQSYGRTGYAVEYSGKPSERFAWTASGRLDDFSDFDHAFTWQLAASQHVSAGLKLRASYGTGSKAPTFTERYGFYADYFIGNPNLKPETSKGWEIGLETDFNHDGPRLGAAWFDQKLRDEIDGFVFDPETFLFTARNRDGNSRRKGLEVVLDGSLAAAFSYAASYTYVDATESGTYGTASREIRRPKHMASASVNYGFAQARGNLKVNANYNGSQLDNYFPPPWFDLQQVKLASFTVVDLAGSWKLTPDLELLCRVSNLFDENYEEILGYARPGRAIYAGLRGRFQR
jgi:vitamin B12 transporter